MVMLVPEFGRLPVGAISPALANQLQIAVEPVKAGGAQSRRYLPLQGGLRVIVGTAHRFCHGKRCGIILLLTGGPARKKSR